MLVLIAVLAPGAERVYTHRRQGYFALAIQLPEAPHSSGPGTTSPIENYLMKQPRGVRGQLRWLELILGTNQTNSASMSCC